MRGKCATVAKVVSSVDVTMLIERLWCLGSALQTIFETDLGHMFRCGIKSRRQVCNVMQYFIKIYFSHNEFFIALLTCRSSSRSRRMCRLDFAPTSGTLN